MRAVLSFAAVLALLTVCIWALRRGSLRLSRFAPRGPISVQTAISLGDRRSLAVVEVEGRRLLVGLTPTTISFLTDLAGEAPAQPSTPEHRR